MRQHMTYPSSRDDESRGDAAHDGGKERPGAGTRSRDKRVTDHAGNDSNNAAEGRHCAKHRAQVQIGRLDALFVVVGDHPGFEHAEEERGADTAGQATKEEHAHVVAEHGEAGNDVEEAVEKAGSLPAEPVGISAGERRADAARDEAGGVEGGDHLLGDLLLILVDGVDMRTLSREEKRNTRQLDGRKNALGLQGLSGLPGASRRPRRERTG